MSKSNVVIGIGLTLGIVFLICACIFFGLGITSDEKDNTYVIEDYEHIEYNSGGVIVSNSTGIHDFDAVDDMDIDNNNVTITTSTWTFQNYTFCILTFISIILLVVTVFVLMIIIR